MAKEKTVEKPGSDVAWQWWFGQNAGRMQLNSLCCDSEKGVIAKLEEVFLGGFMEQRREDGYEFLQWGFVPAFKDAKKLCPKIFAAEHYRKPETDWTAECKAVFLLGWEAGGLSGYKHG